VPVQQLRRFTMGSVKHIVVSEHEGPVRRQGHCVFGGWLFELGF
jgi:hypothetical protein